MAGRLSESNLMDIWNISVNMGFFSVGGGRVMKEGCPWWWKGWELLALRR